MRNKENSLLASRYVAALERLRDQFLVSEAKANATAARFGEAGRCHLDDQYRSEAHAWGCAAAMVEGTLEGMVHG